MSERGNLSFQSFVTNREGAQELTESRYNLLIGLMLAWGFGLNFAITQFLGPRLLGLVAMATAAYDPGLVARAALSTAIVTLIMMIVSSLIPQVFERMAGGLGVALLATIVVESLGMLFFRAAITLTDWAVVIIMCMYIGYDWVRANSVQRTTTNAIAAASALYLDIINIFVRLLSILARSRSDRRD